MNNIRRKRFIIKVILGLTLGLVIGSIMIGCIEEEDPNKAAIKEADPNGFEGYKREDRFSSLDAEVKEMLTEGNYNKAIEEKRGEAVDYEVKLDFDVIVVGTDPEGISAALSSARNGNNTLLIDERSRLGGLMTKGALNTIDMNYNPRGEIITRGIFKEFFSQIEGDSFSVSTAEEVFQDMVKSQENLAWKKGVNFIGPIVEENKVIGIKTLQEDRLVNYGADRVIDATQNADITARAGAPYNVGLEDVGVIGEYQVSTLTFKIENLDWGKMASHLNQTDEASYKSGASNVSAWGFLEEMQAYESENENIRMRGLNLGRESEESAYINALHVFDVNPLDKKSIEESRDEVKKELPLIVDYMRENLPGFEDIELARAADEFYLREGRHIQTEYVLTINDVRESKDFWDKIGLGSYPVDIQPTSKDNTGFVLNDPPKYSVPFRSLVPLEVEDILIVGKGAGFDSLAHGSARVIPVGMTTGEAAGVAAGYSIEKDKSFRDISEDEKAINEIQDTLRNQGAYLPDFDYSFEGENRWTLEGIRFMNSLGLVYGGYENEYGFDEVISGAQFSNMLSNTLVRSFDHVFDFSFDTEKESLTIEEVSEIFLDYLINNELLQKGDNDDIILENNHFEDDYLKKSLELGLVSENTNQKIDNETHLKRDEIYILLKEFATYIEENNLKYQVEEQLYVNEEEIQRARFEREEDTAYVDLSLFEEIINADQLFYNSKNRSYYVRIGGIELKMPLDKKTVTWNQEVETRLNDKIKLLNGRPMITLDDLENFTNADVEISEGGNEIHINY